MGWYRVDVVLTCHSRLPSTRPRCPRGSGSGGRGGVGVERWYRGDAVLTCRSRHPSTRPRCPRGSVSGGQGEGGGGIGEM